VPHLTASSRRAKSGELLAKLRQKCHFLLTWFRQLALCELWRDLQTQNLFLLLQKLSLNPNTYKICWDLIKIDATRIKANIYII
jgi:hypothetical protein